jgi:D-sedoheptulose 7-phosphate isomerase
MQRMSDDFFKLYFSTLAGALQQVSIEDLDRSVAMIREVPINRKKVILAGNGGSAAMASHVAVDLTKAAGIRAINFNEADLLTCFSNDFGYEHWVEKALDFYADKDDLVVLISSSGQSQNILKGAIKAKELGLSLITLTGFRTDNPVRNIGDVNFWVDSTEYNIVEMTHHVWLLSIVDKIIHNRKQY